MPNSMPPTESVVRFCRQHRKALEFMASLGDEQFRQLARELDRYNTDDLARLDVVEHLSTSCEAIMDTQRAAELVDSLMALTLVARLSRVATGEMAAAIAAALQTSAAQDEPLVPTQSIGELRLRLHQLLGSDVIEKLAKGQDIFSENDQTFIDSRIITDIRPVYGEDVDDPPTGMVVVHNLRLRYFREGQERSFTVALRIRDLQDMSQVIERARRKAISFDRLVAELNLTGIDPGDVTPTHVEDRR